MNCANHADVPAVAFCRTCGKPLCSSCARDIRGVIYCEECLASQLSGAMPPPGTTAVPPGAPPVAGLGNPRLAALLGFIPGVGAKYGESSYPWTRTDGPGACRGCSPKARPTSCENNRIGKVRDAGEAGGGNRKKVGNL